MKAVQIRAPGGPEVLEYVEVPDPVPGEGEVLVRAHALGVGKPDALLRTGVYKWMPEMPAILGNEMSGHIEALGSGVEGFAVGQPVLIYGTGGGRYAELNAVSSDFVTPLPDGVDLDAAVSIPNYVTAWALIREAAHGMTTERAYVNGAAGGVGSAIVDVCRHAGIEVIAGASSVAKCELAAGLGAAHTIDYSHEDVPGRVLELTEGRGVNLILDQLVGPRFTDNLEMLAPLGMILSFNALAGMPEEDLFRAMRANLGKSPAVRCFSWHCYDRDPPTRARIIGEVVDLFARGAFAPPIHDKLPLAEAKRAHEMLDAREILGKLVLKP